MTEKLYYQDAYMKEFDSEVVSAAEDEAGCWIELAGTAFYPEGGGQPADQGKLISENGNEIPVTDVQEKDDVIRHRVPLNILKAGDKVHGIIDWERRFDHMQQHSGEHIVSGMICSRFHCDNVGFHMGEDTVTIDYNAVISFEEVCQIENEANKYIWENHMFVQTWPDAEELKHIEYRSKKELSGAVRITSFPGADTCACCGTHVRSSSEVGLVKFISAKSFHGGTRFELYCGKRAMDYLSMNFMANKAVAVLLGTREEKSPELVKKLIEEKMQLKSELADAQNQLLKIRAESVKGQHNVLLIEEGLEAEQGRLLADMVADSCSGWTVVMAGNGNGYRYTVIDHEQDIRDFVKDMNKALNGRGGGRDGFAQGNVNADRQAIEQYFAELR